MALFCVGDSVRVKSFYPPTPPAHVRTPYYIRGCEGIIERICGEFGNPEELAFGRRDKPQSTLYRVRFQQSRVWKNYNGFNLDSIEIELFEFWLAPVLVGK